MLIAFRQGSRLWQPDAETIPARFASNPYEVHCLENVRAESNEDIVYEEIEPIPGIFDSKDSY